MENKEEVLEELTEIRDEIEHLDNQMAAVTIDDPDEQGYLDDQLMRLQELPERIDDLKKKIKE